MKMLSKKNKIILSAYIELTKPSILTLVLVTTLLGFFLGGHGISSLPRLFFTLLGAALTCAGASTLNHYLERDADSKMKRTQNRPLPQGILTPSQALFFGLSLVLSGIAVLCWKVNVLTAFLSLLSTFLYVIVYTPMKKITWWHTTFGAIPGAIPPMGGWTAATGNIDLGAWVLFLILFVWQHPHFYSIAWIFRDDYSKGGFKVLPVIDPSGQRTFRQILIFSLLLLPISVLPSLIGMSGKIYFGGAVLLGSMLLACGTLLFMTKSIVHAKKLLAATVIYLPLLLFLIVIDVGF